MISDEVVCMDFHIQCKRENKLKKCAEIEIDEQIHKNYSYYKRTKNLEVEKNYS